MSAILEDNCTREAFIAPSWVHDGSAFWYRQQKGSDKFSFILVNVHANSIQPAFDHCQVAIELSNLTQTKIEPDALPFIWINLRDDHVYFRYQDKNWEYTFGKGLAVWHGFLMRRNSAFSRRQVASKHLGSSSVTVFFSNHAMKQLKIFWVDEGNKPVFFQTVAKGATGRQKTYPGHVWRVESAESSDDKVIYKVPSDVGQDIVTINDIDLDDHAYFTEDDDEDLDVKEEIKQQQSGLQGSPESQVRLVVHQHNIWLEDQAGIKSQLSVNGTIHNPYDGTMLFLSPCTNFAVAWQYTPEQTPEPAYILNYTSEDSLLPTLEEKRYLKPGEHIRIDRPRLFNLSTKSEVSTNAETFSNPTSLIHLGWSGDGLEYRFIYNDRSQQCRRIIGINYGGNVRVLIEEASSTFIDISTKAYHYLLKSSDRLLWASERDGNNHLYMIDMNAGCVSGQLTKGFWNFRNVEHIDEERGVIWASSYGHPLQRAEDPYHIHLFRVNLDGAGFCVLTQGDGTHSWSWSPGQRKYFLDTWSRVDLPVQIAVRCADTGELRVMLRGATSESLKAQGWDPVERFSAPGRDGQTLIYGIIVRPPNFDENKSYPVLENIYAGPNDFFTPKQFGRVRRLRDWAVEGYVVIQMDGMGTNWRSKAFHDVCYKNAKDAGVPDRILWIQAAARQRPWMNLESGVAVIGSSAGAYNAVSAILHHGHFYKAAVADSGCHDGRIGPRWWNEQWMGYPVDGCYVENSNLTHAGKLEGELMLVVGGLDKNVHPAATMRLVQRLNQEGKYYDLVVIPDGKHNCGSAGYGLLRAKMFIAKFFKQ